VGISAGTAAIIGAVTAVASTAVGVYGSMQSAAAQSKAANYQAQVAANNATIADQNARYAKQAGAEKAAEESLQGRARLGAAITGQAAGGLDVNSGSALDVQATDRAMNKLDTEQVLNNAALNAYGYRSQATGFSANSQLDKMAASSALTAGDINATGSLLSGASGVADKFAKYKQDGTFGSDE
jgi:hypothetical protein